MAVDAGAGAEPVGGREAIPPWALAAVPLAGLVALLHGVLRRPTVLVVATLAGSGVALVPGGAEGGSLTAGDVASVLLVGAVALMLLRERRPLVPRRAALLLGAIALAAAVSTVTSVDPAVSLPGLLRWLQLFVLVPVAVVVVIRDRVDEIVVGAGVLGVAVVQGGVGVVQALTGTGASYGTEEVRAVGTYGADDIMGMATVVSFGLLVALAIAVGHARRGLRCAAGVVALALVGPLLLSFSRGSWIGVLVGAFVVVLLSRWRALVMGAVALVAAGVVLAGLGSGPTDLDRPSVVQERAASIVASASGQTDRSVGDRYGLWQSAVGIWEDHPLTGVGLRAFPEARDTHAPLGLSGGSDVQASGERFHREPLLSPHSLYLLVLAEQGVLGAVALVALLLVTLVAGLQRAVRCVRGRRTAGRDGVASGVAACGLLGFLLVTFVYGDIGGPSSTAIAVGLGLTLWWGLGFRHPAEATHRAAAPTPFPPPPPVPPATDPPRPDASPDPPPEPPPDPASRTRTLLVRASILSIALVTFGSLLGLVRDLLVAGLFGATAQTDAFLLGWMVSETAQPLLIEGAMALVFVPAFVRAAASEDPRRALRELVEGSLPVIALVLVVLSALVAIFAPFLVGVLAPGLADPALAATSMRVAALGLVFIGVAGYLSAFLRGHDVFGPPAAVSTAFNVGLIATLVALHQRIGVMAAVLGIVAGTVCMVAVLLPSTWRRLPRPRAIRRPDALVLAAFLPVGAYILLRQGQVYIERFLGSWLAPGSVSHLNYAQKVGQLPATLALLIATVTFPMLARSAAAGRTDRVRARLVSDLHVITAIVLLSAAFLVLFAGPVVDLLLGRGNFTPGDVTATAGILQVYVLGLVGQGVVEVLCRSFFSRDRPSWYPALVMVGGLVVTAVVGALLLGPLGAPGIALSNAAGITVVALLLVPGAGLALDRSSLPGLARSASMLLVPTAGAVAMGLLLAGALEGLPPVRVVLVGGTGMVVAFGVLLLAHERWVPGRSLFGARPAPRSEEVR
ncbi:lipid II flippase MurJ [Actinomycetospora sp. NBC_00405]|uniref:lipid II flippase MurJ n=1 Tax=Actinomycetospora sp. NBC_00405 TaxID=2975952 RepID=UPI002E20EFD6